MLIQHFKENPVWDYWKKIGICKELGMPLSAVSKWNWENRKKHGMKTKLKRERIDPLGGRFLTIY